MSEPSDHLAGATAAAPPPPSSVPATAPPPPGGPKRSLGSHAARGASTVFVGQAARILIQIASVTVLARLLSPTDYGLVAIVLAVVGVGEIFRDFGLSTAAVQARNLSRAQMDKLFWLNTGIGAGLAVVCLGAAPLVATLFRQPELTAITRVLALTFLFNGAAAQYRANLNRNLRFRALVGVDVGSQVIGTVVAILLGLSGAGYWALVGQQLTAALATLLGCVMFARWIPRLPRRDVDVRSMVRFGIGLVGTQVVGYLSSNVDTLVIGLRFSATQLGYYNRGYQLLMRPLSQLRTPTTSVALPVLSRLHDDKARTDSFIVLGQLALGYTLVAGTAIAAGAADPIVALFLGDSWGAVVPVFSLLAIAGIFQTISYVGNWVYLSRALTSSLLWYSLISLAIKIVCVLIGSTWGVVGVAAGFAVAPALAWPISLWWLSRLTDLPVGALYVGAGRILGCAAAAGGTTFLVVDVILAHSADLLRLACGVGAGLAVYALIALVVPTVRRDLRDVVAVGRQSVRR